MKEIGLLVLLACSLAFGSGRHVHDAPRQRTLEKSILTLEALASYLDDGKDEYEVVPARVKRSGGNGNRGVTNLDIRDAIFKLLEVISNSSRRLEKEGTKNLEMSERILRKLDVRGGAGGGGSSASTDKKLDNISTFLLRMNPKLESIERRMKRVGGRGGDLLETLAQESFDILTLLPTYIQNTKDAITALSKETKEKFSSIENILVGGDSEVDGGGKSLTKVLQSTESNILAASSELKEVVIESGHMAESLFERVNDGYRDLTREIKGLSNVEQVLLDTADAVMDTKRKIEFGVSQIIFKVEELVKMSGGRLDNQLKDQFADITKTILANQTEALGNLTKKVEKEIGQVWRQMGIMYGQVSNSIKILEKVKDTTEGYVNNTGKNLGTMEGQVEGLTDRMVDVDSNLNYMLGQLSLVVQEFNQVKTGLGEAMQGLGDELEEIKEYQPREE